MSEMMKHLKEIEHNLDKETYRRVVAEVVIKHFIALMEDKGKSLNRRKLMQRTNLTLQSMEIEEVSYGFIRRFY